MSQRSFFNLLFALLIVTAAVISSIMYAAYRDLNAAQSATQDARYSDAAQLYESAARKLLWRADLWERAGLAAYRVGDKDNAIRLFEIARKKKSISAQGWDALGLAYWSKDDRNTALSVWQSGAQTNPSYAPLYDRLAAAYHEQGDYASEQDVLIKRLALEDDASARYRLGLLLMLTDADRAQKEFLSASSLDPQFDSAIQTLRAALNIASLEPDPSRRLVIIGRGLGLVEEWGLAARAFDQAVRADARNAEAWAWLGEARQQKGDALSLSKGQDGRAELDKALSMDPSDTVVRALRGLYWKRLGRFTDALNEYLQAAQIEPQNPAWQASIGEVYVQTGDLVSALDAYQKATTLAPNDATYWRLLAVFSANNDLQVLEIGLPAAQKAAALAPQDAQVLDTLGWTYMQAGYLYNAEQTLLSAIRIQPDLAIAHLHLAQTYLKQGNNASALNELNLAKQLDPNGSSGEIAAQMLKQYFP